MKIDTQGMSYGTSKGDGRSIEEQRAAIPPAQFNQVNLISDALKIELKQLINEVLEEELPPGVGYSSKEAITIVEKGLEDYAKILRKAQYKIIKDFLSKAKAGVIDYFDLMRGIKANQVQRTYPYEADFLRSVLIKDKIIDRFRSYFGGRKGMRR